MKDDIELDRLDGEVVRYTQAKDGTKYVYSMSRDFILRAYTALQAKIKEEEEAKTIKVGDWVVCLRTYCVNDYSSTHPYNVTNTIGTIAQVVVESYMLSHPEYQAYWRKLTSEEVSRLPKP